MRSSFTHIYYVYISIYHVALLDIGPKNKELTFCQNIFVPMTKQDFGITSVLEFLA